MCRHCLMLSHGQWHQHTQGNIYAKEYVEKFDEFLIRCNTLHREGKTQILSRFRASFRDDLQTKLLAREVNELETACALVQDLDSAKTTHTSKDHNYRASVSKLYPYPQPNSSSIQIPLYRDDIKGKSLEHHNRNKDPDSFRVSSTTKCYKC